MFSSLLSALGFSKLEYTAYTAAEEDGEKYRANADLIGVNRHFSHYPLKISDHVYIGPGTVVEAALIGAHTHIGSNCVIGKFAIIKEYVKVLDGTVVPPNMVLPPFSIVGGRPAQVVGELMEGEVDGMDLREMYRSVGNS